MTKLTLQADQSIVYIGDSITDCSWRDPYYTPLGTGYVNFAANLLLAKYPEYNLKIYNRGISGDTTRNLKERWQKDCLDLKSDILSILIGVNDLWRRHGTAEQIPAAVYPDEYEANLRFLLNEVKKARPSCQLVLMEPFMFCTDQKNVMFNNLFDYTKVVNALSIEYKAVLVPLQNLADCQMTKVSPEKWSHDMVHPSTWAHAWIALSWLEATGL